MPPRSRKPTEEPLPSGTASRTQPPPDASRPQAAATAARIGAARTAAQQMLAGDPCAIRTQPLPPIVIQPPSELTNLSRVTRAGELLIVHHFGTRLRFMAAVDRARELLDDDKICLDNALIASAQNDPGQLVNLLNCWPRVKEMLPPGNLTRLTARVLGIGNADAPPLDRNTTIQPQLNELIDALNEACNPACSRDHPTAADAQRLGMAARRVRANFSASVSDGMTLRIRQLDLNLAIAQVILTDLEPFIGTAPCSLGSNSGVFGTLIALVGDDLKADGIDLTEAAEVGQAWTDIFAWLTDPNYPDPGAAQCKAAAILRPSYRRDRSKQCSD